MHNPVNKHNYKLLILPVFIALMLGYGAGNNNLVEKIFAQTVSVPSLSFINGSSSEPTKSLLLDEVREYLSTSFVSWKATYTPPTAKELEYGMVAGYVGAYNDPYTHYFPPVEAQSFKETVKGSFGGVGMEVGNREGLITIIAPLKDSPAKKAGIGAGDVLLKVDDKDVTNITVEQAVSMIRGEIGTEVKLTILQKGQKVSKDFKIKREEIKIPTIDTQIISGVFVISLYSFNSESPELFKNALIKFSESKTDKLVIDLRGNPGGYLDAAVEIASFFLPEGKVVVKENGSDPAMTQEIRSKGYNVFGDKLKLSVIVDEGSASASEILAGALQDHKVATVYGQKSYGKGSVQQLIDLKNGGSLKVTIAKWYTPNGRSITEDKIVPDVLLTRGTSTTLESETKNIVNLILKAK